MGGASVSLNYEKITDRYASTGERLSGVYAGSGGLDVVVQGDTVLKAGVLDSEAPSSLNRFSTGSLSASSIDDTSEWEGLATGVAASFGASTSTTQGSFNGKASQGGSGGTFELGIGVVSHHEHGTSNSAISGNIEVNAGSLSGSYTTDVSSANGHLANKFDAHAVEKTLQAEVGGEMAAEGTAEAVYQLVASSQKGADTDQDGSEKQNTDVDATSAAHGAGASDDGTVSGGSPSPDGSSSGGASPRGTGATPSSIITQKVALGGSGRKTGFIEWYTSNPDGVTVNARRVTVVDQTVKTPGNSGVTAINLAANGTMQRLDYLKDNGQNKDVLDFITPPPLMDAIALYNLITHIGAGRYKDAAEDAAPFALGLAGAEAGPYLGKAAKAVLTKENIQEAIDKAAGLLGKSHEWKPYESGSVGAAQPSLPDGYSWVKNAEGDLGIKTPEGQVVSDSQGKTEILLDHRNSYDSQGEIVAEQNVAEDGAERGVLIDANFAQNRIKSDRSFSPDGQKIYSDLAGKPIKTVDDLAAALKAGIVKPSQIPVDYVDMNGNRLILNTRTSTALEQAGIPRSEWFGRNQTGVEVYPGKTFNDLASDQLKNNKLPPTGAETLRSVRP